jgi:hypothetical protein
MGASSNTWANIVINLSIGLVTTVLLLIVYEVARRVPSFSEALFDIKRSIRPHRTPPPLMRSRCKPGSTHWRWPSLLEFLFFSLSKEYIDYSSAICEDEKRIIERKKKVKASERIVGHDSELVAESSSLVATEDQKAPAETNLIMLVDSKHRDAKCQHVMNEKEHYTLKDAVQDNSNEADDVREGIMDNTSYPSRHKYFSLPIDLTGPTSVFYFVRMLVKRDESRHESVHLGSLILQTQRVRPLSYEDAELLRCIGLDSFIMIRFLRFGFEVCVIFFVIACLVLLPTYFSSDYTGLNTSTNSSTSDQPNGDNLTIVTYGYYSVTIDRVEPGSFRLVVSEN